jgi:hypothetical protein
MWVSTISPPALYGYLRRIDVGRKAVPLASMPRYLVELYLPKPDAGGRRAAAAKARSAARALTREGTPVRYVRSIFIPDDETYFHLFEGPSAEAVRMASERAGMSPSRIVAADG